MRKIGIIGVGPVGITYAYTLIQQQLVDELVLIDLNQELLRAQVADLEDASALQNNKIKIKAGTYADLIDAEIVCITAAAKATKVINRLDFVNVNAKIITQISKELIKNDFSGKIILSSNPVDVMTQVCQSVTKFNPNHVIGSGTILDSARLSKQLAKQLGVAVEAIDTLVIGEHGDSSVPIYSKTTIANIELAEYLNLKQLMIDLDQVYNDMRTGGYEIFRVKGETSYGIATYLTKITNAIINDTKEVLPVSVHTTGQYGLSGVTIALPAIIGKNGVEQIKVIDLTTNESKLLQDSGNLLKSVYNSIE